MFIYIIYVFISPLLWLGLLLISFFNTKIREHWNKLWQTINVVQNDIKKNKNNREIILFHAASAGEFEQLIPIIKLLDKKKYYIVQSFFSPTIYNKEFNTTLVNSVCYHPFDFILSSYFFFKKINPEYYIITRHDIWPSHIIIANFFNIKTFFINANMYKESKRLKFPMIYLNKWIFTYFDKILTPSLRIKTNLELLISPKKIFFTGDSRFDRIKHRMEENKFNFFPKTIKTSKNIIFGSVIKSDFKLIFQALNEFFPMGDQSLIEKNIKIIFVPHEIDKKTILNIVNSFKKLNMEPKIYNQVKKTITNIIIINKIGILADLYKYGDLAYIGGGFGAGVHSVIEPAIYGLIVTYGPKIDILDEAIEMTESKIGFRVKNYTDLIKFFHLLNNDQTLSNHKQKNITFIMDKTGASKKIINEVFK